MNTTLRNFPIRKFAGVLACLSLAVFLAVSLAASPAEAPSRVVAIGDVHGDFDALVGILREARLIDGQHRWSGDNATFVLTGDFTDRGPKVKQVMDLLMTLEREAARKKGRVVVLLGNHETMNLIGDLRYVTPEIYATFASPDHVQRRQEAYRNHVEFLKRRAATLNLPPPKETPESEQAWMDAHPPGYVEYVEALMPEGKYGRWLREKDVLAQIGDTLYLHGGIHPILGKLKVTEINRLAKDELRAYDNFRRYMVLEKLALPTFNFEELAESARLELDARKASLAKAAALATAHGMETSGPSEWEKRHIALLDQFLGFPSWTIIHADGPVWFRGLALWDEQETAPQVDEMLKGFGAKRFVLGHTTAKDGHIHQRYGGKVFLIDTGMLASHYQGRASALEILGQTITAIYPGQRVVLHRATDAVGAVLSNGPGASETELPGGGLAEFHSDLQPTGDIRQEQGSSAEPQAPKGHIWIDEKGNPLPFKTDEEVLEFLRTARLVSMRDVGTGITRPRQAVLEKDGVRVRAIFRDVNEEKDVATLATGQREMFFRDTYIFEPAAYELALMLGLDNVPPVVERRIRGTVGSLQIWVEKSMRETDRQRDRIPPPDAIRWNRQVQNMRVFDNLIYNTDRNMGNILIDAEWKLWMIDHTRAFRRYDELKEPATIIQCERKFFESLKNFNEEEAKQRLKKWLRSYEIEAILKRRKLLVEHIQKMIEANGEAEVLFDFN